MPLGRSKTENIHRSVDLQEVLADLILKIEFDLNAVGFGTSEIHDAFEEVLANRRQALAEDPDPAEDP